MDVFSCGLNGKSSSCYWARSESLVGGQGDWAHAGGMVGAASRLRLVIQAKGEWGNVTGREKVFLSFCNFHKRKLAI